VLDGPLRLFGSWALLRTRLRLHGRDLRFVGLFVFCYFAKKGFFPCHQGTLMAVPDRHYLI
jgi:hypothetical protein